MRVVVDTVDRTHQVQWLQCTMCLVLLAPALSPTELDALRRNLRGNRAFGWSSPVLTCCQRVPQPCRTYGICVNRTQASCACGVLATVRGKAMRGSMHVLLRGKAGMRESRERCMWHHRLSLLNGLSDYLENVAATRCCGRIEPLSFAVSTVPP